MSIQMIQNRLDGYDCQTQQEEDEAIREITQEVVLAALGRTDFFEQALFQGGTCLRIFHGLNRFSEDMDFILRTPDSCFSLDAYLKPVAQELSAYGYDIEIADRSKAGRAVKMAFLKDDSIGKVLRLHSVGETGRARTIKIKVEVDSNPPLGSGEELKYLDFPFVSAVATQDPSSLFAGKIHAILCRTYLKGRDWYDFLWYSREGIGINHDFLRAAIFQTGPWEGKSISVDHAWVLNELEQKIKSLNWQTATNDVRRFVRVHEQPSLELWGKELFLQQLEKWNRSQR